MKINAKIVIASFYSVSSQCYEIGEKFKGRNDFESFLMLYDPLEDYKTLIEMLTSRGCPKDRIYDVLAFYGGCVAFRIKINTEEAIDNAPNVKIHEILNFHESEMHFLDYDCPTKESVAQMIQTEKEDALVFVLLGISEVCKEFHISEENVNFLFVFLLSFEKPLSHDFLEFLYLSSQWASFINEVCFKCIKTIIPELKISDINFDIENFAEIESDSVLYSSFLMKSNRLFCLLKSSYFCRSDRSVVFKLLKGIDYEKLEDHFYSNDKDAFCKYVREASNYKNVNLLCSIFGKIKCLTAWMNGPVQGKFVFSKLYNFPLGSESRSYLKQVKDESFDNENTNGQLKYISQLFDTIISSYPSVYKELEDCINPTVMDKIDKIIDESPVCKKIFGDIKQKNESVEGKDDQVVDTSLGSENRIYNGLLPFPSTMGEKELREIEKEFFPNQNFFQLFVTKEKPVSKLRWNLSWSRLEYVIKVMYCGYVNEKGEIRLSCDVDDFVWETIVDCFVNKNGKKTTVKSLGTNGWGKRLDKYNEEFESFFKNLLPKK